MNLAAMTPAPGQTSVTVPLSASAAFELFVNQINIWWPVIPYSLAAATGGKPRKIEVSPHKGGLIEEVSTDGTRHPWGRIIAYDAGRYLAFTWFPGKPEAEATVVAVAFVPTPDGCRVELSHGGADILGPLADAVSTSYLRGWALVMGCYQSHVARELVAA